MRNCSISFSVRHSENGINERFTGKKHVMEVRETCFVESFERYSFVKYFFIIFKLKLSSYDIRNVVNVLTTAFYIVLKSL